MKKLLASSILVLMGFSLILVNVNIALAEQVSPIVFDALSYDEEGEYLQHCLSRLGYTSSDNRALDQDGHFGSKSQSALAKFLKSQGLDSFDHNSKELLIQEAEGTVGNKLKSGFNSNSNLSSTAFVYSSVSNIDESQDPFYSMENLKNFDYIITSKPDEMSYKSKKVIQHIKKDSHVFGYVNLGPDNPLANKSDWRQADLEKVKSEIDSIADAAYYGVFIDQFGYDWGETRERQNIIVDYAHGKGLSVMANGWVPSDTLSSKVDAFANPKGVESHLGVDDWYLIESFFTDGDSYRADKTYIDKYLQAKEYSKATGVNITALSYKIHNTTWDQSGDDINNSYILAHLLEFDGWWFGNTDGSDYLLYGKSQIELGSIIKPLTLEANNKYVAETENYIIEYFAEKTPTLNLILK